MKKHKYNAKIIFFTFVLIFEIISCNNEKATIEGTLTLPASVSDKVFAVVIDNDTDTDNGHIKILTAAAFGSVIEYSMPDAPPGTYYINAFVDTTGNGIDAGRDTGDYEGWYDTNSTTPPTERNAEIPESGTVTFDIELQIK